MSTNTKTNYDQEARNDAKQIVEYFEAEMVEMLENDQEISDDLYNDYPNGDGYFNETFQQESYTLLEAAEVLDQLSSHEETDGGLWQGLPPREAISCQAAFTYGNAVSYYFQNLVQEINDQYQEELKILEQDETYNNLQQAIKEGDEAAENALHDWKEEHNKLNLAANTIQKFVN